MLLFDPVKGRAATAELTNWKSLPASMTYCTVSVLGSNERAVLQVRRGGNIRSVYEQVVGRDGDGAVEEYMPSRSICQGGVGTLRTLGRLL